MKELVYVLIVDDEPLWQDFCRKALESEGYVVEIVNSLKDAFSRVSERVFALVVVDDLALRSEEATELSENVAETQKVIIVSAMPSVKAVRDSYKSMRIDDFKPKPFEKRTLVELVKAHLA